MARRWLAGFRLPRISWSDGLTTTETPPSGHSDLMVINSPLLGADPYLVHKDSNDNFWYAGSSPIVVPDVDAYAVIAFTYAHLLPLGLPIYVQSTASIYILVEISGSRTFIGPFKTESGLREVLTYTSNGTFNKGSYPWLRAVRIKCQGGGGGGGGVISNTGRTAIGAGGSGGHYAESYFEVTSIPSGNITVTRGAGGSAGSSSAGTGGNGGTSSFGSLVVAHGGIGGAGEDAAGFFGATPRVVGSTLPNSSTPTGQIIVRGGASQAGTAQGTNWAASGAGGDSFLGKGGGSVAVVSASTTGNAGGQYGGGGSGAAGAANGTNRAGGAGAIGIVIVELYG